MTQSDVSLVECPSRRPAVAGRRGAFTIIELLVVISIIVLLIAMLLPAIGAARQVARTAYCKSTMRQTVGACLAYASDHLGKIPPNRINYQGHSKFVTWRVLVADNGYYSRDSTDWECPEDIPPMPGWTKSALSELDSGGVHGSATEDDIASNYAFNGSEFWRWGNWPAANFIWQQEVNLELIGNPSTTFMLLETRNVFPDLGSWMVQHQQTVPGGGSLGFWHDYGANWGKVDGHVEWATVPGSGAPECWWHDAKAPTYNGYSAGLPASYGSHSHPDWIAQVNVLYLKP